MPVDWLRAMSGLAGAGRGYENARMGRPPGTPGAAPATAGGGGGSGILGALAARRKQRQESFGQPTRTFSPPPGAAQAPAAPSMMAEPPVPQPGAPPAGMSPDLMRPVPGGSPMQGPAPPAMSPPGMTPPDGGPPPGAGGPTPPVNPYPGLQGDNDDDDNPDQRMANGGVVNKPTTALLGEDGPEMVVPLNQRPGNKVSLANLPGQRPGLPPGPGGGAPPPRAPMISPAMRYRSRFR